KYSRTHLLNRRKLSLQVAHIQTPRVAQIGESSHRLPDPHRERRPRQVTNCTVDGRVIHGWSYRNRWAAVGYQFATRARRVFVDERNDARNVDGFAMQIKDVSAVRRPICASNKCSRGIGHVLKIGCTTETYVKWQVENNGFHC